MAPENFERSMVSPNPGLQTTGTSFLSGQLSPRMPAACCVMLSQSLSKPTTINITRIMHD